MDVGGEHYRRAALARDRRAHWEERGDRALAAQYAAVERAALAQARLADDAGASRG